MTFSGQSKQKRCPPFSGRFSSFSHLPIFRSHVGHSISLVYLKFLTLSATNSKLLIKMQLSERKFPYRDHAGKVLTVTCLIAFCIQEGRPWRCLLCKLVEYNANNHLHLSIKSYCEYDIPLSFLGLFKSGRLPPPSDYPRRHPCCANIFTDCKVFFFHLWPRMCYLPLFLFTFIS